MTTIGEQGSADGDSGKLGRRGFISKAGTAALAVPLTTSLVVSASSVPAVAKSPYGGNGGGHKPGHKGGKGGRGKGNSKPKHKPRRR
ncbi:MAG: hypothetical protein ACM35H_10520 [Bacteroidota bacterium]